MSLVLELAPEVEERVREEATRRGKSPNAYAGELVERAVGIEAASVESPDPRDVMALPLDERRRILAAGAERVADLYNRDLARPVAERELTAFTSLDSDLLYEYDTTRSSTRGGLARRPGTDARSGNAQGSTCRCDRLEFYRTASASSDRPFH